MSQFKTKWVKGSRFIACLSILFLIGQAQSEGLEISDEEPAELTVKALGEPVELRYWFNEENQQRDTQTSFQLYIIYHPCESAEKLWFITKMGMLETPTVFCSHNSNKGIACSQEQELVLHFNIPVDLGFVNEHCFYAAEVKSEQELAELDRSEWTQLEIQNFSAQVAHVTRWDPEVEE